jgi:predicted nucleic acid-binding protein
MASILVDTGVWYALCDSRDRTVPQEAVDDIYARVKVHSIVVPWPIAYETLRTRFVRNRLALERFEQEIKSPRIVFLDDEPYREDGLTLSIESSLRRGRPLSMVDCVLRLLLDDSQDKNTLSRHVQSTRLPRHLRSAPDRALVSMTFTPSLIPMRRTTRRGWIDDEPICARRGAASGPRA